MVSLVALFLACLTLPSRVAAEDEPTRPSFSFLRQNEDWSVLHEIPADRRTGRFDAIKYVALSDDERLWLSLGGSFRLRFEDWVGFGFGAPAVDSDSFLLARVFAHADLHWSDRARLFLELNAVQSTDRELPGGKRPIDVDTFDVQQGFVDVTLGRGPRGSLTLRLGRQAYSFGRQRLVSPLPWANALRSWDGATLRVRRRAWSVDAFWSLFVPVDRYDLNRSDSDQRFSGAYARRSGAGPRGYEAYLLWLDRLDDVTFNGTTGPESRYTLGMRGSTSIPRGSLDVEVAWQTGSLGSESIDAGMAAVELAIDLTRSDSAPEAVLGLDYATGDRERGGNVQTFNQLFPLGHAYLGYLDVVGRQNVIDASLGVRARPARPLRASLTAHRLRRVEDADALYNPLGGVVFEGAPGTSLDVGTEVDLVVRYTPSTYTIVEVGLGRLFAGDFPKQVSPGDDIDFGYVQFEYRF